MSRAIKRIQKELEKWDAANGLVVKIVNNMEWCVTFNGATGTLYEGETFSLRIRFNENYPIESPQVVFNLPGPVHSHIYSNGHICLNILGEDWSPALTVQSVCLSIQSMLSSATVKIRPPDDARYSSSKSNESNPKMTHFAYHDDGV